MHSNIHSLSVKTGSFSPEAVLDQLKTKGLVVINDCQFDSQEEFLDFVSQISQPLEFSYSKNQTESVSTINHIDKNHVLFPQAGARWNDKMTGDWHLDVVFADPLVNYTILYSKVSTPHMGHTWFADSTEAYHDLSLGFRSIIDDLRVTHYRQPNKRYTQRDWELEYLHGNTDSIDPRDLIKLKSWLESAFQKTTRPLITRDSGNNPCIYLVPSKAVNFDGLTEDESRTLIEFLAKHVTKPEYIYSHEWTQGQVVIWSNARMWHYGVYNYKGFPRELWRCHLG